MRDLRDLLFAGDAMRRTPPDVRPRSAFHFPVPVHASGAGWQSARGLQKGSVKAEGGNLLPCCIPKRVGADSADQHRVVILTAWHEPRSRAVRLPEPWSARTNPTTPRRPQESMLSPRHPVNTDYDKLSGHPLRNSQYGWPRNSCQLFFRAPQESRITRRKLSRMSLAGNFGFRNRSTWADCNHANVGAGLMG